MIDLTLRKCDTTECKTCLHYPQNWTVTVPQGGVNCPIPAGLYIMPLTGFQPIISGITLAEYTYFNFDGSFPHPAPPPPTQIAIQLGFCGEVFYNVAIIVSGQITKFYPEPNCNLGFFPITSLFLRLHAWNSSTGMNQEYYYFLPEHVIPNCSGQNTLFKAYGGNVFSTNFCCCNINPLTCLCSFPNTMTVQSL